MTDFRLPALHVLGTHIYRNTVRKTGGQTDKYCVTEEFEANLQDKFFTLTKSTAHCESTSGNAIWVAFIIRQLNVNC